MNEWMESTTEARTHKIKINNKMMKKKNPKIDFNDHTSKFVSDSVFGWGSFNLINVSNKLLDNHILLT